MALLSDYPQGGAVVVLAVAPAPVSNVSIKRRLVSSDVDISSFGTRNRRKRTGQQLTASVSVLFRFLVEYPVGSQSHRTQRVSVATHSAMPMVIPPASDDRSKFVRFHLGTIVRVVDNVFNFLTERFEVCL